jgi:hypothetical protein
LEGAKQRFFYSGLGVFGDEGKQIPTFFEIFVQTDETFGEAR